jgi:hypothetical protein
MLFTQCTKRRITHVFHWREKQGEFSQFYVTDLYHQAKIRFIEEEWKEEREERGREERGREERAEISKKSLNFQIQL